MFIVKIDYVYLLKVREHFRGISFTCACNIILSNGHIQYNVKMAMFVFSIAIAQYLHTADKFVM